MNAKAEQALVVRAQEVANQIEDDIAKSKLKFSPFSDFVLIDPIPVDTTPGGIALPEGADTGPARGRVVKVGPGRHDNGVWVEPDVVEGEIVYMAFAYSQPIPMEFNGHKYILARARDLIGSTGEIALPDGEVLDFGESLEDDDEDDCDE